MARILIADDIADNRELFRYMFSPTHQIIEAADGREALEMFFQHQPDIVITDLAMPYMDGRDFLKQIGYADWSYKVIACSGYFDDPVMRR